MVFRIGISSAATIKILQVHVPQPHFSYQCASFESDRHRKKLKEIFSKKLGVLQKPVIQYSVSLINKGKKWLWF